MEERKSKQREKKEAIVATLAEKAGRAKAFVFTNPSGMTHRQLEDLKRALKQADAELTVTKNTLLKRALLPDTFATSLSGPTATMFSYGDLIAPLKQLAKTIKALSKPIIKFGIIDGKLLAESDVIRLSTVPTRDVLLAQLVVQMQSPLYGLHRALSWNVQKLVMTLKVIENSKQASS